MRAPKRIYWVEMITPGASSKLRYGQRGSGKFTDLKAAKDRKEQISRIGIESKIYQTQPLEWSEVSEDES